MQKRSNEGAKKVHFIVGVFAPSLDSPPWSLMEAFLFAARLARHRKRLFTTSEHTLFIFALSTALRAYSFCAVASNLLRIRRFVFVRDFFLRVRGRLLCMFFCGQPSARRRAMLYIKVKSEL